MPLVETPEMFEEQPLLTSAADAAAVARAAASTAAASAGFGAGGDLAALEGGGGEFVPAPADPDAPQCRICYGKDDDMCGENGRLFRPCRCKGSVQPVVRPDDHFAFGVDRSRPDSHCAALCAILCC